MDYKGTVLNVEMTTKPTIYTIKYETVIVKRPLRKISYNPTQTHATADKLLN